MSIRIVERQITNFIRWKSPSVIAIKGAWGAGKTFFWKKIFNELQRAGEVGLNQYAYVSVFGINSLDELKLEIFTKVNSLEISAVNQNIQLKEKVGQWANHYKSVIVPNSGGNTPFVDTTESIRLFGYGSLENVIVCIDDIERKGKDLPMKDILGLISTLKEEKHCKVCIIFNDEVLEGTDRDDYEEYREKVIDTELQFYPTAEECADIALTPRYKSATILKEYCTRLGIQNIRILKKIEFLARQITLILDQEKFDPDLEYQALRTLCLFTWCFYGKRLGAPGFEYAKKFNWETTPVNVQQSEATERWNTIFHHYGYTAPNELDMEIIASIENGYFNRAAFVEKAKLVNERVRNSKLVGSYESAWSLYRDSFDDNGNEVVHMIDQSFRDGIHHMTPSDLNATMKLFKELGHTEKARDILGLYILNRQAEKTLFDLENLPYSDEIDDADLRDAFKDHYKKLVLQKSFQEVLDELTQKAGWSKEDELILASASEDDFYQIFKKARGNNLRQYIQHSLQFGTSTNPSRHQQLIFNTAVEALRRIASESTVNRSRVSKYVKFA